MLSKTLYAKQQYYSRVHFMVNKDINLSTTDK